MKKAATAILLFDFVAGLLFLGLYGMQSGTVAAEDVKKIAITRNPYRILIAFRLRYLNFKAIIGTAKWSVLANNQIVFIR